MRVACATRNARNTTLTTTTGASHSKRCATGRAVLRQKGTPYAELGLDDPKWSDAQLIDFMLSVEFQESIPLTWFVFPVNQNAELPDEFVRFAQIPDQPAELDPAEISANREHWIQAWTETVLR